MKNIIDKLKEITLNKFGIESEEIVYITFLRNNERFKLTGSKSEKNFIKILDENNIQYTIEKYMNGIQYLALIK
jgi:hypothetical protein